LWRPNLGIPPERSQVKHWTDLHSKNHYQKRKNNEEEEWKSAKERTQSVLSCYINNAPTTLSRTLYYEKGFNKQTSEKWEPVFL
jgi:hypothetical protein